MITRRARALAVPVLSALVLSLAQPAVAQTHGDLDAFRRELMQVLVDLDQQRALIKQSGFVGNALPQARLEEVPPLATVQLQLERMTYDELATVQTAFATAFPRWREAPAALSRVVDQIRRHQARRSPVARDTLAQAPDFTTSAITADNCQDAFNAAPSWTDWGVAKAFEIAAQAAYEVIPEPFNAAAMVAWVPLAEGTLAAEILNNMFDRCSGDQTDATVATALTNIQSSQTTIINTDNSNTASVLSSLSTAKTDIVNNDNSNRTTITTSIGTSTSTVTSAITNAQTNINSTSNANTATIVSNDNANRTAIVNNATTNTASIVANANTNTTTITTALATAKADILANANGNATALTDLLLRTQIEADLGEADSAVPVALYLTPTANGGYLNLVQTIVTQTLANIVAAGGSVGNAQSFLSSANADKAAGRFKDAYKNYRKAYKMAVN